MSTYPYNVLTKHGLHPQSTAAAVHNLDTRDLNAEAEAARTALRNLQTRLKIDFFLYRVSNPQGIRDVLDRFRKMNRAPQPQDVARLMEQDAPVLLLLMNERVQARAIWESAQRKTPEDTRLAHRLALLCYAEAQDCEERRDFPNAENNWRLAIAQWVRTMSDTQYWEQWCDERRACYGVEAIPLDMKKGVYEDLQVKLSKEFMAYSERYSQEGNRERAQAHRDLKLEHEIEWLGLRALREISGPSGGPLLVRHLGLGQAVSKLLNDRRKELAEYERLEGTEYLRARRPTAEEPLLRRVQLYFSTLAPAAALLENNRPEEALLRIPSSFGPGPENISYQSFENPAAAFRRDVAELGIRCHVALSAAGIENSHPNLSSARAAWRAALRLGQKSGLHTKAAAAIRDQIVELGRTLNRETKADELNRIIEAMNTARDVLAGSPGEGIDAQLASALDRRGVRRVNINDHEGGVADLNTAFKLSPGNAGIRADFCRALLYWSRDLHVEQGPAQAQKQLKLAQRLVRDGLNLHPDDETLTDVGNLVSNELDGLAGKGGAGLETAHQRLNEAIGPQVSVDAVDKLVSSAQHKSENEDYSGAVDDLIEALQLSPDSGFAKDVLRAICVEWARELLEDGEIDEADAKMKLVLDHNVDPGPDPKLLEQIRWAKIFKYGEGK